MELSAVTLNGFTYVVALIGGLIWLGLSWKKKKKPYLPPGPPGWPLVGNVLELRGWKQSFQQYVHKLHKLYGPIITLRLGSRPLIIVASHEFAYEALIHKGSIFADRPAVKGGRKLFTHNQTSINSAAYGPFWRTLRRNLVSETLSASSLKSFRKGREWGIEVLMNRLRNEAEQGSGLVKLIDHLRHAAFCTLLYMCFGARLEEKIVRDVECIQRDVILRAGKTQADDIFPVLGFVFRKRWKRLQGMRQRQMEILGELINRRRAVLAEGMAGECRAYIDTLLCLTVEGGRGLNDAELVTLCSEFLNAGTDTTSTTLQWAMANLVKDEGVQSRLYEEIVNVVGKERAVEEEDVSRMVYLEALVKETLRRHPPGHLVLMHAVTEASTVGGYDVPANAMINFSVREMGNDPRVWENPNEFRPDRFLCDDVDLTGIREIKLMPFGVGRRICPGIGLAMMHVQLVVARLVQKFVWESKPGEPVDLAEVEEFTVVMKNPLHAVMKQRD
ncbi:cytochrome P450 77A1 [Cryptomeria japonica]|uniref:cytochrome P450 77A1 n=1 Tax=Cryptomeria japonica TaxID=3369 RepID=UPI0027DA22B1|nr:cytochrome P450 77A1 [Cryptomeria japonica]